MTCLAKIKSSDKKQKSLNFRIFFAFSNQNKSLSDSRLKKYAKSQRTWQFV